MCVDVRKISPRGPFSIGSRQIALKLGHIADFMAQLAPVSMNCFKLIIVVVEKNKLCVLSYVICDVIYNRLETRLISAWKVPVGS